MLPYADKQAMTLHLATIGEAVTPAAHAVVIVDGAGWHKPGGRLTLPDNVSTLILPPYSPELNPQENIWQYLRQNYLSNRVFGTYEAIVDACCAAWMALIAYSAEVGRRFRLKSATCSNRSRPGIPVKSAGVASSAD